MYKKMQSIKRLIDKKLFEVAEKEIIKGYEIAIATVEQLEKMFLNK